MAAPLISGASGGASMVPAVNRTQDMSWYKLISFAISFNVAWNYFYIAKLGSGNNIGCEVSSPPFNFFFYYVLSKNLPSRDEIKETDKRLVLLVLGLPFAALALQIAAQKGGAWELSTWLFYATRTAATCVSVVRLPTYYRNIKMSKSHWGEKFLYFVIFLISILYAITNAGPIASALETKADNLTRNPLWKDGGRLFLSIVASLFLVPFIFVHTLRGIVIVKAGFFGGSFSEIEKVTGLPLQDMHWFKKLLWGGTVLLGCGFAGMTGDASALVDPDDNVPYLQKDGPRWLNWWVNEGNTTLITALMNFFSCGCMFFQASSILLQASSILLQAFKRVCARCAVAQTKKGVSAMPGGLSNYENEQFAGVLQDDLESKGGESPLKLGCPCDVERRTETPASSQSSQLGSYPCLPELDDDTESSSRAGTPYGTSWGDTPPVSPVSAVPKCFNGNNRGISPPPRVSGNPCLPSSSVQALQAVTWFDGEKNLCRASSSVHALQTMDSVDEERSLQASPQSGPAPAPAQVLSSLSI